LAGTGTRSMLIPWARCSVSGDYRQKATKQVSCCPLVSQGTALKSPLHKDWIEETKFLTFTCWWLKVYCPMPFSLGSVGWNSLSSSPHYFSSLIKWVPSGLFEEYFVFMICCL
jgi:hypothetical protein